MLRAFQQYSTSKMGGCSEKLCAMEPSLRLKSFMPPPGIEPRPQA